MASPSCWRTTQGACPSVQARDGRRLVFHWTVVAGFYPRVASVDLPNGSAITYEYDAAYARLTHLTYASGGGDTYLYNEAANSAYTGFGRGYFLTGIVDASSARYSTFRYDSQARDPYRACGWCGRFRFHGQRQRRRTSSARPDCWSCESFRRWRDPASDLGDRTGMRRPGFAIESHGYDSLVFNDIDTNFIGDPPGATSLRLHHPWFETHRGGGAVNAHVSAGLPTTPGTRQVQTDLACGLPASRPERLTDFAAEWAGPIRFAGDARPADGALSGRAGECRVDGVSPAVQGESGRQRLRRPARAASGGAGDATPRVSAWPTRRAER
ncbi:MAG: RHS repeat protein [Xanthomonadales bacterium]|nr:RHS repeat protein [Xanthomonadales bacterium]